MPWRQAQAQVQGPSWYVPAFCVTAKVMLFCVDGSGLYFNERTEAEGVKGRVLRRVFGLRGLEVTATGEHCIRSLSP